MKIVTLLNPRIWSKNNKLQDNKVILKNCILIGSGMQFMVISSGVKDRLNPLSQVIMG
jgi:hypothetical protein